VIALVVTPEGLPLAYEVLAGNTADSKTLRLFFGKIEQHYGKARCVWWWIAASRPRRSWPRCAIAIRRCTTWWGHPRAAEPLGEHLLDKPWQEARHGVKVKLLAEDGDLYVFAQSTDRVAKERAMRRRQLKWLWKRLDKSPPWMSPAKSC